MSDAVAQVTWAQVAAWRMARHGLVERAPAANALDVVSRICGPPVASDADGDAAVSEIVLRYLSVYGPATRADLARWWGWQPAAAGRRLKALGDAVVPVDVEGVASWARAAADRRAAIESATRLLGG